MQSLARARSGRIKVQEQRAERAVVRVQAQVRGNAGRSRASLVEHEHEVVGADVNWLLISLKSAQSAMTMLC